MSEITTQEVIAELQRGARVFKAFERAEDVCVKLAGMEQNERELTGRLDKLRDDVAQAEASIRTATARAGEIVADANNESVARLAQASIESGAILDNARMNADGIVKHAQEQAAESEAKRDAAEKSLAEIEAKIRESGSELENIESRLKAARAERDRLLSA